MLAMMINPAANVHACQANVPDLRPALRGGARRGITLLEVLISMFVLLIGLMGVAAMIPAGRFEILQGTKGDQAAMVGRAAFRDLKVRGYLNPASWYQSGGNRRSTTPPIHRRSILEAATRRQVFAAIDPLGLYPPTTFGIYFPLGSKHRSCICRAFMRVARRPRIATLADLTFRSSDDLITVANTASGVKDRPPCSACSRIPQVTTFGAFSDGTYSWLATIVNDPTQSALSSKLTVSVAVFLQTRLQPLPMRPAPT